MDIQERRQKLSAILQQIAPENRAENLAESVDEAGLESMDSGDQELEAANAGIEKIARTEADHLTDEEMYGLEAIVLPKQRPVVDIIADTFNTPPSPWTHFGSGDAKAAIEAVIPSVGRVELPHHDRVPYGGTGFVVGDSLLMTNRHVVELFANGLGVRELAFRPGQTSQVDFRREVIPADPILVEVKEIVMIHPWWDVALLKVDGLPEPQRPLALSVAHPDDLAEHDIAVIGYPAQDSRNDLDLQNRIFRGVFNVKRMHPGKLKAVQSTRSYGRYVNALTHDSSTLGGNSGSAVVDVASGLVVGLHFAGRYLEANYAVPTFELARDSRVIDLGLNFVDTVPTTDEYDEAWRLADSETTTPVAAPVAVDLQSVSIGGATQSPAGATTWSIPIHVSLSVGAPVVAEQDRRGDAVATVEPEAEFTLKPDADYRNRKGYDPDFLGAEFSIPLPRLTTEQYANVAFNKLASEDRHVLPYHNFSLVMNKERRLAYFTAVNIDGKREKDISRNEFSDKWFLDPRIDEADQLQNDLYRRNRFDRGHLVRRLDPVWGRIRDARKAHDDTFHWTNCSPQHEQFNRNRTTWGLVENWILETARAKNQKVSVFTGPVLKDNDKRFTTEAGDVVQIPNQFWKVVAMLNHDDELSVTAYLLTQQELISDMVEAIPKEPELFQTTVMRLEKLTQLAFGDLIAHDTLSQHHNEEAMEGPETLELLIDSFEDLKL